jgi:hypothetical protein
MSGSRALGVILIVGAVAIPYWVGQARGWWAQSSAPWNSAPKATAKTAPANSSSV